MGNPRPSHGGLVCRPGERRAAQARGVRSRAAGEGGRTGGCMGFWSAWAWFVLISTRCGLRFASMGVIRPDVCARLILRWPTPRRLRWKASSRGFRSACEDVVGQKKKSQFAPQRAHLTSSFDKSSCTRLYEHFPIARSPENFFDTRMGAQFRRSANKARIVKPSGQFGTRPVLKRAATFSAYASSSPA